MSYSLPTREQVIVMTQRLIAGAVNPDYVQEWASAYLMPEFSDAYERMEKDDPALAELIDALAIAAETHDGKNAMYDEESYKSWIEEFYKQEQFYKNLNS